MQLSTAAIRLATARQVRWILGIDQRTLDRWVKADIIRPAMPGPGKGGRHLFSVVDLLAIALARDLRGRGFGLRDCGAAVEALRGRELADLQREWSAGRTHLLIVSGEATPFLAPAGTIDYPGVKQRLAGKLWAWIDTKAAFEKLTAALNATERTPA